MKRLLPLLSFFLAAAGYGQSYSIMWYKIAGGGGASAGGPYSITGTTGQPDASHGALTGGPYSLTGGFWTFYAMQTPGLPYLSIVRNTPNSVTVFWPNTGSYTLQQNSSLANGNWTTSASPVTTVNGTNSVTITPPAGHLFFRLKQ